MYSIFTCVWLIFITHVGKYTMTMDGIYIYGKMASQCIWLSHLPQQKSQASEVPKPTSKISGCVSQLGNLGATHNNTWQHGGTMDRNLGQILEDMENNWSPDILVGGCEVMLKISNGNQCIENKIEQKTREQNQGFGTIMKKEQVPSGLELETWRWKRERERKRETAAERETSFVL